jgi:hypothetical protein
MHCLLAKYEYLMRGTKPRVIFPYIAVSEVFYAVILRLYVFISMAPSLSSLCDAGRGFAFISLEGSYEWQQF